MLHKNIARWTSGRWRMPNSIYCISPSCATSHENSTCCVGFIDIRMRYKIYFIYKIAVLEIMTISWVLLIKHLRLSDKRMEIFMLLKFYWTNHRAETSLWSRSEKITFYLSKGFNDPIFSAQFVCNWYVEFQWQRFVGKITIEFWSSSLSWISKG